MGAFLFVKFVSACFPLAPVLCGFAVKGRACPLVRASRGYMVRFSVGKSWAQCSSFHFALLPLLSAPPIGGYFNLRGVSVNPSK